MARRTPIVFISSTAEDLKPLGYRQAAETAVKRLELVPRMFEYWVASGDKLALDTCLEKVDGADVLVVIVAHRYGWEPPDQPGSKDERKSITWLECQHAKEVLAFIVDEAAQWPDEHYEDYELTKAMRERRRSREERLALTAEVDRRVARLGDFKRWLGQHMLDTFRNPDDLRDKVSAALNDWLRRRHPEFGEPEAGRPRPSQDPAKYLRLLRDRTAYIDIRGLQVGSGKAHRFPIEDLYISLTTTAGLTGEARHGGGRRQKLAEAVPERPARVPLHEALSHPRLVVVGDPGSGKTTFLRRVAHSLCQAWLDEDPDAARTRLGLEDRPFPILVEVEKLAEHVAESRRQVGRERPTTRETAAWLPHFLATASQSEQWGLDEEFFRARLGSPCVLLVDGLDQAPTRPQRESLSRLVEGIGSAYGQCRIVVTSRLAAYVGAAVLPEFAHAQIDPLDDGAVETFVTHWCGQVWSASPSEAARYRDELLAALRVPEIRRIARNPVMLTALAVVHWNEKRLPEQRADLYDSVITWLSRSREQRPGRAPAEVCVTRLGELALAMQAHGRGRRLQVPKREAAEALARAVAGKVKAEHIAAAEKFLDEEEVDSGIVVGRGDEVRFWHPTFQEFLAARAIAGRVEKDQEKLLVQEPTRLYSPEWREVVLLLAGLLRKQGAGKVDGFASALIDRLGRRPTVADRARAVGLLGAIVRDLAPVGFEIADPRYGDLQEQVLPIFDKQRSTSIAIEVRIEAADALGQPGDPRLDPWVTIPGGKFLMGAQKRDRRKPGYDPEADDDESPHEVELDSYRIGRYPVAVGEYRQFVGEGCADSRWWGAGGLGQWPEPEGWDRQTQFPNRPVVGVSWFEAAAFCEWARVNLGWERCQLPTEAEWERAARGTEGRRFPWGNEDADPSRLNYHQSRIGRATPVGIYPLGATPDGIHDMAGNVWEWCQDRYGPYEQSPTGNPRGPERGEYRVLRGGAWNGGAGGCRAAGRNWNTPVNRYHDIGFRVVVGVGGGTRNG